MDSSLGHEEMLDQLIHNFWEIENVSPSKASLNCEDQCAVDAVKESLVYRDGRYEVGIPWKQNSEKLQNNYDMAFKRLLNTEKKLCKDQTLLKEYDNVIRAYLKKGYIRKVSLKEQQQTKWLLPHFPVVKLDRDTTKVRIVFDASAKYKEVSLNDVIHQGPKLQNDLFDILLRFRRYPIAIICDIAEMYLQIGIVETDRQFFRFLWRSDQHSQPDVYEFSRVVFGMNCSPFLAQYITKEHAKLHEKELPLAAETVAKSTYMDDNMTSVETDSNAIELYNQLKQLWSSAGMYARKWISNSVAVLDQIPVEDRVKEIDITLSELPSVKVLGLAWNAELDEFRFSHSAPNRDIRFTKRSFLRETAKLFDPLGLLSPFSIRARILLQKMWLAGLDWDQTLKPDLEQETSLWFKEMGERSSLAFPRCVSSVDQFEDIQLHVFVDASQDAYGAVAYSVHQHANMPRSRLVAAKGCVAPLKAVSIPRMELLAAVLGVKLITAVTSALGSVQQKVTLWSDSQNVLYWIRSQSRCFKPFVAHRIGYIQEHTNPNQWKHISSNLNPADIISRGSKIETLKGSKWLNGPEFLTLDEHQWSNQSIQFEANESSEIKSSSSLQFGLVTQSMDTLWRLDPSRYSDLKRYCRVIAWVYRFLNNTRFGTSSDRKGDLSMDELTDAEAKVLSYAQKKEFEAEYIALSEGKTLSAKSKLLGLRPFLDLSGLMRSSGRLRYADRLSYDSRFPIILPRHSWLTKLVVKPFHEKCCHMGTNNTLSAMSSKFWVISAREVIRQWEKECAWCQLKKTKPASQVMGDLPEVRVRSSLRAFEKTAVDFAGPFVTMQGRGKKRQKRYLCLFTCLTTRAVHLEIGFISECLVPYGKQTWYAKGNGL